MENPEKNLMGQETVAEENLYVKTVESLREKYKGERLFPMGEIQEVTYANSGKTLSLELSGDVPTNFEPINIIFVHPDSDDKGWIGVGHVGVTIAGSGVDIGRLPLPEETVNTIKHIYRQYSGKEASFSFDTKQGSDATQFAQIGLYNNIVEKK